jgi:hypothetical protein
MPRWPLALLAGLLLLQACPPCAAYGVVPRGAHSRALLQKDAADDGPADGNAPPSAKRAPPAPDDDPADFPPRVMEMLAGYLDNKALVSFCWRGWRETRWRLF